MWSKITDWIIGRLFKIFFILAVAPSPSPVGCPAQVVHTLQASQSFRRPNLQINECLKIWLWNKFPRGAYFEPGSANKLFVNWMTHGLDSLKYGFRFNIFTAPSVYQISVIHFRFSPSGDGKSNISAQIPTASWDPSEQMLMNVLQCTHVHVLPTRALCWICFANFAVFGSTSCWLWI